MWRQPMLNRNAEERIDEELHEEFMVFILWRNGSTVA